MRRRWGGAAVLALTGCLASPPGSNDAGGDGDTADAAPPIPPIDIALIGDLLTLDLNDDTVSEILLDRSGSSRHADRGGTARAEGAFGAARTLSGNTVFLAGDADLGPRTGGGFTVEAYVFLTAAGQVATVAGDFTAADPQVTFELQVDNESSLRFTMNDAGEVEPVVSAALSIPLEAWTHVAVTWDGLEVAFYLDGEAAGSGPQTAAVIPASDHRFVRIGGRAAGTAQLLGAVDEVKISSYAKTEEQIAASRAFDSRELVGRCGDNLLEAGEACAGIGLCCDELCQPLAADPACAAGGGTCSGGLCKVTGARRVTTGLVAYYTFDSVFGGSQILDESGVEPLAHLVGSASLESQGGAVILDGDVVLRSDAAGKIAQACTQSDELTLEAWVAPAFDSQDGPARIVTYSNGPNQRNFLLGQEGDLWVARVRTEGTELNGRPTIGSAGAAPRTAQLSHLVVTVARGLRRFYVDGKLRSSGRMPGTFGGWTPDYPLLVGNEEGGGRVWAGAIHLLAIYDRALDDLEVASNFAAGSEPL